MRGLAAVRLGLPEIDADGLAKLAAAASLRKYNPDWQEEPRMPAGGSAGGQWTTDSDGNGGESRNVSRRNIAMSPESMEEWEQVDRFRGALSDGGLLGASGYLEFGRTYDQCARGQVPAACGGDPVG